MSVCDVCGSKKYEYLYGGVFVSCVKCLNCGNIYKTWENKLVGNDKTFYTKNLFKSLGIQRIKEVNSK